MSKDWYQDIVDYHEEVMYDKFSESPSIPSESYKNLRATLIIEEIKETMHAITDNSLVELADGIADSIVVLLGTAVTYGIDMRPIWDIVHESNMAKKGGKMRIDGKLLKPDGWVGPNIADEIVRQQNAMNTSIIPSGYKE